MPHPRWPFHCHRIGLRNPGHSRDVRNLELVVAEESDAGGAASWLTRAGNNRRPGEADAAVASLHVKAAKRRAFQRFLQIVPIEKSTTYAESIACGRTNPSSSAISNR